MAVSTLRVVQWATGNIGTKALREVIRHPRFELVGVFVHTAEKVGLDAGELCGVAEPTGVVATDSVDEVIGLGADCVLYMPRACDFDVVGRVLGSGSNIVTTRGEFHHPPSLDSDKRTMIEEACRRGGTSIYSTGSSPGFITEAVPLALASIQTHLECLAIHEYADLSERNSPGLLFEVMGYGKDPARFESHGRAAHGVAAFGPSLRLTAEALGAPLDSIEGTGAVAAAARTIDIAAGRIAKGTVAAQRMTVHGMHAGRPLLSFSANWYCTTDLDQDWDLRPTGWRIVVDGDAPLDIEMPFPVSMEQMGATTPGYTANRAVNAVPFVCAAPPGIRTTIDLPHIVPRLTR